MPSSHEIRILVRKVLTHNQFVARFPLRVEVAGTKSNQWIPSGPGLAFPDLILDTAGGRSCLPLQVAKNLSILGKPAGTAPFTLYYRFGDLRQFCFSCTCELTPT